MADLPIFKGGWNPELETGTRTGAGWRSLLQTVAPFRAGGEPLPDSFSLSRFKHYPFDQGQAGTCWGNTAVQLMQIHTAVEIEVERKPWDLVPLSRRFACFWGKKADGTGGNPDDGGAVSAALVAMSNHATYGRGCCHEELCPYPDGNERSMRAALAQPPSPEAVNNGSHNWVTQVADVDTGLGDAARRSIFNGHPIGIGMPWPPLWDTLRRAVFDQTGSYSTHGGHAVLLIGWHLAGGVRYWQIENSHGSIYIPLAEAEAARIPGYEPLLINQYGFPGVNDFWVAEPALLSVLHRHGSTATVAAGLFGFATRSVFSFLEAFE